MGFFGSGAIARKIADAAVYNNRLVLYGVASRNVENARKFAKEYSVLHVYNEYSQMLQDNQIDVVYISTPTKQHYECIKKCLEAGKHVISEKPFVETKGQAIELFELAKRQHLLLIDALWTMYMPVMAFIREMYMGGGLGRIRFATGSLGYPSIRKIGRKLSSNFELWDYEVYPLSTMLYLFGEPIGVKKRDYLVDNIKMANRIVLTYSNMSARIHSSLLYRTSYILSVFGSKGILISRKWWLGNFPVLIWNFPFHFIKKKFQHSVNGYEYELNEMISCLDTGKITSNTYPAESTLSVFKWMDKIRGT